MNNSTLWETQLGAIVAALSKLAPKLGNLAAGIIELLKNDDVFAEDVATKIVASYLSPENTLRRLHMTFNEAEEEWGKTAMSLRNKIHVEAADLIYGCRYASQSLQKIQDMSLDDLIQTYKTDGIDGLIMVRELLFWIMLIRAVRIFLASVAVYNSNIREAIAAEGVNGSLRYFSHVFPIEWKLIASIIDCGFHSFDTIKSCFYTALLMEMENSQ